MFTATKDLISPSATTGSWRRPRWFDVGLWGSTIPRGLRARARRPVL